MSSVVTAFIRYRSEKAKIKARQRVELDAALAPYLRDLGAEIVSERQRGNTVADIQILIGTKNKTFIYDAIRAVEGGKVEETKTPVETPMDVAYTIDYRENSALVSFADRDYVVYIRSDGGLDIPDDWMTNTANKALFSTIVREIVQHESAKN